MWVFWSPSLIKFLSFLFWMKWLATNQNMRQTISFWSSVSYEPWCHLWTIEVCAGRRVKVNEMNFLMLDLTSGWLLGTLHVSVKHLSRMRTFIQIYRVKKQSLFLCFCNRIKAFVKKITCFRQYSEMWMFLILFGSKYLMKN